MMENTRYYCTGCGRELYGSEGYYYQMCEWLQKQGEKAKDKGC